MTTKNERRAQAERIKKRTKRFLKDVWQNDTLAESETFVGKYAKTKVMCSDPECCGNPRRISNSEKNKTIQEQKVDLDEDE